MKMEYFSRTYSALVWSWFQVVAAWTLVIHYRSRQLLVAQTLAVLNRFAYRCNRYDSRRDFIYAMKTELIRRWYQRGLCSSLTVDVQTQHCYKCGRTGKYDDENECWSCAGTGVYDQTKLLRFEFPISGHLFVWHQPEGMVLMRYRYKLTSDVGGIYQRYEVPDWKDPDRNTINRLSAIVNLYLAGKIPAPNQQNSVFGAFFTDLSWIVRRLKFGMQMRMDSLYRLLISTVCRLSRHVVSEENFENYEEIVQYSTYRDHFLSCHRCGLRIREGTKIEIKKLREVMFPEREYAPGDGNEIPF